MRRDEENRQSPIAESKNASKIDKEENNSPVLHDDSSSCQSFDETKLGPEANVKEKFEKDIEEKIVKILSIHIDVETRSLKLKCRPEHFISERNEKESFLDDKDEKVKKKES